MRTILKWKTLFVVMGISGLTLVSCTEEEPEPDPNVVDPDIANGDQSINFNIDGEIFSIPSPVQTAMLIKETGATYDAEILNPASNTPNYATTYLKALNLGIYGADLGYTTLYDDDEKALSYLNSVMQLSESLNLSGAFDQVLIERFSNNLGNQDSMLVIVSDAYRAGDNYLKNNDRSHVASLVLAGGWIESLHFATNVAQSGGNQDVMNRIGEQKTALYSLISLLQHYNNEEEYADLTQDLIDLWKCFDNVTFEYNFVQPETDEENKITHIKSTTNVSISDADLQAITEKLNEIRNQIIG